MANLIVCYAILHLWLECQMQCSRQRICSSSAVVSTYIRMYIVCSGECLNYYAPLLQPASNAILVKTPKFPFASLITKPFQVKVRVRSGKQQQESSNHMTFTYQPPGECGAM